MVIFAKKYLIIENKGKTGFRVKLLPFRRPAVGIKYIYTLIIDFIYIKSSMKAPGVDCTSI